MLRRHEATHSWKAGALAIAVHVALLGAMLISIDWKAAHPVLNVTEVELWDKLPAEKPTLTITPKLKQPVEKPEPIEKTEPEPKPEPEPKRSEVKIEDPKVDIVLKKNKKEPEPKLLTQEKPVLEKDNKEAQRKLAQQMRGEDLQEKINDQREKRETADALKKLQENLLNEDGESKAEAKASSTANASVIGEFKAKIQAKIRGNVNKTLCEDIYAEPKFKISLLPTGDLSGSPILTKSSGVVACDNAVERAIQASQPLPMPNDPNLFSSFRDLNLTFKPND